MLTECLEPRWALCAGDVGAIEIAAGCDFNGSCVEFPTQVAAGSLPGEQGAADPQYAVKHTPYLQLGNAPLVGLPGSETDQIEIVWQTIPAGAGTEDAFVVEYRVAGAAAWTSAAAPTTLNTGVQGRINWSVVIAGLTYHSDYEYRVRHVRAGMDVATYQHGFQTRLAAGDPTPFQFAAYGDSAAAVSPSGRPERFIPVQNRINASEAAFALLLGDNAYENATHVEFDLRMDPAVNPATTEFTASRVDYYVMGNHDFASVGTAGRPTVENYSVPVPVEGVTSPVAGPATALPERNYSFDYGSAHFVAFDSTPCEFSTPHCVSNPQRWQDQLAWLIADLQASSARWKVVFAHIPLATLSAYQSPIHPGTTYYEQLLGALQVGGADLYLAGHDHSWQRSYPLTGRIGNQATFVLDTDGEYEKGAGLVQVVSGLGGRSLYTGAIETDQYVARGYNGSTSPLARYGHAQVDVAVDRITVQYVAADNGEVLDSVSIVASNEPEPPTITRVIVGNDVEQAAVPVGSGEQLRTLPIGGVDRITLEFSRPMVGLVTPSLSLLGRDGAYTVVDLAESPGPNGAWLATWYLGELVRADQLTIALASGLVDELGSALDGEWDNPLDLNDATGDQFPSGDGVAGGAFSFRFTVLTGDANRDNTVDAADYAIWRSHFGAPAGAGFDEGDWSGDGFVTGADYTIWADHAGRSFVAAPVILGDANLDDHVNAADYAMWRASYGQHAGTATWSHGDFSRDGRVSAADYTLWADYFGSAAAAPPPTDEEQRAVAAIAAFSEHLAIDRAARDAALADLPVDWHCVRLFEYPIGGPLPASYWLRGE